MWGSLADFKLHPTRGPTAHEGHEMHACSPCSEASRLQRAEALHQAQCRYSAISASASALPALRQDELREFLVINIH